MPLAAHIPLEVQQLGLGPVPGGPQHPGLPVPAEDVPLGELSARGDLHHLLGAQLPAEHLGVCHRPVHGHVLNLLFTIEAAQCQDARLKCYMNCTATVKKRVCSPQLEFWPCT